MTEITNNVQNSISWTSAGGRVGLVEAYHILVGLNTFLVTDFPQAFKGLLRSSVVLDLQRKHLYYYNTTGVQASPERNACVYTRIRQNGSYHRCINNYLREAHDLLPSAIPFKISAARAGFAAHKKDRFIKSI